MRDPKRWISDYPALAARVVERSSRPQSRDHGVHHWQLVAWTGARLIPDVRGADPDVVFCFALFHDSVRFNEFDDPGHGERGGELAAQLLTDWPHLTSSQLDDLVFACTHHTKGELSDDPSIGACWDSDRLNLWRVGHEPDPRYLSTATARRPQRISWALDLQSEEYSWEQVCTAYSRLDRS